MQGWRKNNEDGHVTAVDFEPGHSLFAVFDGHGGVEVAKFCEAHILDELRGSEEFKNRNYEKALVDTFLKMDTMLLAPAGKKELDKIGKKYNMGPGAVESADYAFQAGCTANVLLITPNAIYCANAGDSRSVLCKKGIASELSEDHKPDLPTERARILASGHSVDDGRVDGIIAISRAIGDWEYKNPKLSPEKMAVSAYPEVQKVELTADLDFVICACDGIWDCMTSQEACEFVKSGKKLLASYKPSPSTTKGKPGLKEKDTKKKSERKMEETITKSVFKGLATIVEMMMEQNCPKDLAKSEGLGCDNMTAIIIEFKK